MLVALAASGCAAVRDTSVPGGQTGALRVREVHVPGSPYYVEGAITYVRVAGEEHTLQPPEDLRLELPAGTHQIEIWHRPCDGNCGNLDPPADRCSGSVELHQGETALATIRENPGRGCELALGRVGIAYTQTDRRDIGGLRGGVWFAQPDGTHPVRLADASAIVPAALSPDGTRIAFVRMTQHPRSANIYIVSTDGGGPVLVRRVRGPHAFVSDLTWSPDSSRLVSGENPGLFVFRARVESSAHRIRSNAGGPTFSPDGAQIAYTRSGKKRSDIYVYDVASGSSRALTRNGRSFAAVWGPASVVFSRATGRGARFDLWTVSPGGHARRLTHTSAGIVPVAWSGDGSRLLAENPASHNGRLWAVDAETGAAHAITDWVGDLYGLGLSSEGRTVLAGIGCGAFISPVGRVETLPFTGGEPHVIVDGPCRATWND